MTNSNKIFVSPGIYTSEKDLTFVSQNVGLTTLGLVGETLKGPAFEPVLIKNYNEFKTIFGSTSKEKTGDNNPKYPLPYVAKSYLEESDQLFVTRVLGLTGYKGHYSYVLETQYGNDPLNKLALVAFKSRGSYIDEELTLQVEASSNINISSTGLTTNVFDEFTLTITGLTGTKTFTCSLNSSSPKFVTKVLGVSVFDKNQDDFPLYVDEVYPNNIKSLANRGLITGFTVSIITHDNQNDFLTEWKTSSSPYIVSEVRGGQVSDLFKIHTISDGNSSNFEVKITISDVDLNTGEFSLLVRDFYDTDDNMIVYEKFSRCTLNPDLNSFIGRKIGTADGEYELKSKYIMVSLADNCPIDAIPAGFRGYPTKELDSGSILGDIIYKTKFYDAGDETDIIDNITDDLIVARKTDKYRSTSLGVSSQEKFDKDLLKFKGDFTDKTTRGFHLSSQAANITGNTINGKEFITTEYNLEGDDKGKLSSSDFRKFTFLTSGGYDGWDIYRDIRTNTDRFIFGGQFYLSGTTENGGVFNTEYGNSDYYAYFDGLRTYANPQSIDINILATPGINIRDNYSLVQEAIEMIEVERADSFYIAELPGPFNDVVTAEEASEVILDSEIDSNYTATYWPWIQIKDTELNSNLYVPPTGEVVRNIALTDNKFYPWYAPAGYSRGLVKSIKAFKKLRLDETDVLYKNRINPIATFSDTGTIIWGNKTLQIKESALNRINVRRLLLRTRKLISAVAIRLIFDQNNQELANEFLRLVRPILETIKKENGLSDFRIDVSIDPEDGDSNTLRGIIYIKPVRSLEFIDLQFVITPTGASFDNI